MDSNKLREKFIGFFKERDHKVIPSASLLPAEIDPTVLFTTAGMQQFKRYYSEPNQAPTARVASVQKCIRTGDIEEVGDDTHLTFFEMLGNFSFGYPKREGSYFKKESISFAWEFLTKVLEIEKSRIHATYFKGEKGVPEDRESLEILKSIDGLGKVVSQGFDDNFWSLGTENSPGGPTVEFYIDGIEVWNLVFNEYILKNGSYLSSEFKGVDTGMGFERLLSTLQGARNVYETELFSEIIHEIEQISEKPYDEHKIEFRIIADHLKAGVFAINDGVLPSNKDAGYVVRRLIRRAIVKAQQLGIQENFMSLIADKIFGIYDGSYSFNKDFVKSELEKEENKFRKTLQNGLKHISSREELSGRDLFNLYQSFGLPLEISLEEANRQSINIKTSAIEEYKELFKKHQELSRTASAGLFKGGLADSGEETKKLHTAAHLLLAALRKVLGESVFQKGSNITAERLRFDFSYPEKMTSEQIKRVEALVNDQIRADLPVEMKEISLEEAKKQGAMGVFESKYGQKVKVYSIGSFSKEICGGPHAERTGELGHFKVTKEESSSAGVRRIKAILE